MNLVAFNRRDYIFLVKDVEKDSDGWLQVHTYFHIDKRALA
jgi:hypothetical protein